MTSFLPSREALRLKSGAVETVQQHVGRGTVHRRRSCVAEAVQQRVDTAKARAFVHKAFVPVPFHKLRVLIGWAGQGA